MIKRLWLLLLVAGIFAVTCKRNFKNPFDPAMPLSPPVLMQPAAGERLATQRPAFIWRRIFGAEAYELTVGLEKDFQTRALQQQVKDTTYSPVAALADTTYWWRVRVPSRSEWSEGRAFTIDTTPPEIPHLLQPPAAAVTRQTLVKFIWAAVAGAAKYHLQLAADMQMSALLVDRFIETDTSFTTPASLSQGTYYWRLSALDDLGNESAFSNIWSFTIDLSELPAPTLLAPADGALTNDATPAFDWSDVAGASTYEMQIDQDIAFADPIVEVDGLSVSEYQPASALEDGTLYWRARAKDAEGLPGQWSNSRSLHIDTIGPQAPQALSPTGEQILTTRRPEFDWTDVSDAVEYNLELARNETGAPTVLDTAGIVVSALSMPFDLDTTDYMWRVRARDLAGNWGQFSGPPALFSVREAACPSPALIAPAAGATLNDKQPIFDWSDITGAKSYHLQVYLASDFSQKAVDDSSISASQFQPQSTMPDGDYAWRVRAKNQQGKWCDWSSPRTFSIDTQGPPPPVLSSPSPGEIVTTATPKFDWADVNGAAGYHLQVDNNDFFTSPEIDESALLVSEFTPSAPLADGVHYYRVRAKDGLGNWGDWANFIGFTIHTTRPAVPTLLAPANGALTNNNTPTFDWSDVSAAFSYQLQLAGDSLFAVVKVDVSGLPSSSYTPLNPIADGVHFWRVRARDGFNQFGDWSEVFSLTIDTQPPATPALQSPEDGSLSSNSRPTFRWQAVSDAEKYRLQVAPSVTFSSTVIDVPNIDTTQFTPSGALADGQHWWRVQAQDRAGNWSFYSPARSLTIDTTPPAVPALLQPASGDSASFQTLAFAWNPVGGATRYHLQVDDDAAFTSPVIDRDDLTAAMFTPAGAPAAGLYYWRVRAQDGAGNWSNFPTAMSFRLYPIVIEWEKKIGGGGDDLGKALVVNVDGSIVFIGATESLGQGSRDIWLVKTDANGNLMWQKTYGNSEIDEGDDIRATSDGGYILAGYIWAPSGNDQRDMWLMKTDALGDTVWAHQWGGPDWQWGHSATETSDGGFAITGMTMALNPVPDVFIAKTNSNGVELWTKTFGADLFEEGYWIEEMGDGSLLIAATASSLVGSGKNDVLVLNVPTDGSRLDTYYIGASGDDLARQVLITSDGGFLIAGSTDSYGNNRQLYLIKAHIAGGSLNVEWEQHYGGPLLDSGGSVRETPDGGYLVAGVKNGISARFDGTDKSSFWIFKIDANGVMQWERVFNPGTEETPAAVIRRTPDGGYAVIGYTYSTPGGDADAWLVKLK